MVFKRVDLVPVKGLLSSYPRKSRPKEKLPIEALGEAAMVTPDLNSALIELDKAVKQQNGTLYITELFRSWDTQAKAREDYETKKKKAFVAPPGGSFHQAGRAVDFSVKELNFQNLSEDKWLQKFWDLAKPLGFRPIIRIPDLNMSECWHFDFPGKDWLKLYDLADDFEHDAITYASVAKCCILDIGKWDPNAGSTSMKNMFIQSQLLRLGQHDIGDVDGILGFKTSRAINSLGFAGMSIDQVATLIASRK
jgi:hypothetical protein